MRQARDRQRESIALSGSNPGKSVANIFRHRSSSRRGHELPPLLNDNKISLTDDTDEAELFSASFAKHLATESDPVDLQSIFVDITPNFTPTSHVVINHRGFVVQISCKIVTYIKDKMDPDTEHRGTPISTAAEPDFS
nr:unnamed protein product [Spirometra erinaceieuropaei]